LLARVHGWSDTAEVPSQIFDGEPCSATPNAKLGSEVAPEAFVAGSYSFQ